MLPYFTKELTKRFINDNNLPIPLVDDANMLEYYLNMYRHQYNSKDLYFQMCKEIEENFDGDPNKFLVNYYQVRDDMINDILDNPYYKDFINADMKQYEICDELKSIQKGNVYNTENVGKYFLSIDLSKANFQALKYFNKTIVRNSETYADYVRSYTDSPYMLNSKYMRQVIFGKCNASRQITIEKYLMSVFYKGFIKSNCKSFMELVRSNNDELVFQIKDFPTALSIAEINNVINDTIIKTGINVSSKIYKLKAICLHSEKTNHDRPWSYVLKNISNGHYELKEVPLAFHALTYKLYEHGCVIKQDYYFKYERLDAYIDDVFTLKVKE